MSNPLTVYRKRQEPPISEAELARKLGISRSFLHRLERGQRKAGTDLLLKIRDELGIPPAEMRPDLAANAAMFSEAAE